MHGVAVISMEDQRLLATFTDPRSEGSPTHQIRCDCWILTLIDIPGHDLGVCGGLSLHAANTTTAVDQPNCHG
jgi:hypothetical protein